jgi:hypothetical protein
MLTEQGRAGSLQKKNPEEKISGIAFKQLVLFVVNSLCLHFSKRRRGIVL